MKDERLQIKEKVKERYGKIALAENSSEGCSAPTECCGGRSNSAVSATSSSPSYQFELDLGGPKCNSG